MRFDQHLEKLISPGGILVDEGLLFISVVFLGILIEPIPEEDVVNIRSLVRGQLQDFLLREPSLDDKNLLIRCLTTGPRQGVEVMGERFVTHQFVHDRSEVGLSVPIHLCHVFKHQVDRIGELALESHVQTRFDVSGNSTRVVSLV